MAEKKREGARILGRADVLTAEDLTIAEVPVPEWGGVLLVRNLSGAERDEFEAGTIKFAGNKVIPTLENTRARLVAMAACDENGARIFSEADVLELAKKSARPLDRAFEKASELSGLSDADVKELVSGFTKGPSGGSGSS